MLVFTTDNETGEKGEQVRDEDALASIIDLLDVYDATIDSSMITYPVKGVYSGTYATQQEITTSNCDECDAALPQTSPPTPPVVAVPSPTASETASATPPNTNESSTCMTRELSWVAACVSVLVYSW